MKIIDRNTGRTVATIVTNHTMSLDEAIDLVGVRLQPENIGDPDVSINDEEYSYEDLDLIADGTKLYTIRPEYVESWTNLPEDEAKPVTMEEIERCAMEWDVPVSELMEQVEEIDD